VFAPNSIRLQKNSAIYTASLSYNELSAQALYSAKRSIIDSIGCARGAYNAEPIQAVCAMAAQLSAAKPATLCGTRVKSSREMAGFANSPMIRYLDIRDDY